MEDATTVIGEADIVQVMVEDRRGYRHKGRTHSEIGYHGGNREGGPATGSNGPGGQRASELARVEQAPSTRLCNLLLE